MRQPDNSKFLPVPGFDSFVTTPVLLLFCIWNPAFGGAMTPSLGSLDPLLTTIVLATLAVGLPILVVLSIRFLWDRNLNLGRSKELEKLIWQLHRIASALEHKMNLSFPAVQPGTEEPRDLAFLQQLVAQPPAAQQPTVPSPGPQQPSAEVQRHGVNSMFGL
jgi:hypothetical protein